MKIRITFFLFFALMAASSVFSQSVKDIKWELPTFEMNYRGTPGSESPQKEIFSVHSSCNDFTPAMDFLNSNQGLKVITFTLTKPGFVNIKIYDEKGNTVDELARSSFSKGDHIIKWNSYEFSQGNYYYSVITGEYSITKKIK